MKIRKFAICLVALLLICCLPVFANGETEGASGDDGIDYDSMSVEELYEYAKKEGGTIEVYAATADAYKATERFKMKYPDLKIEYISIDNGDAVKKITLESETGNVNADVLLAKDNSGEIYNELVLYDMLDIYLPEAADHIDPSLLKYGLPIYVSFNPWYYNPEQYPDGCPITSWWDLVEGYNTKTASYKDASGKSAQKWTLYTKDITGPSYAALFAQLIADADALAEQYKKQYGKDVEITYEKYLNNTTGVMEFPKNNAGVELFWRFTQLEMTELDDGDGVCEAVDLSINGPTLGLTSASKIDNAEMGYKIAWCAPLYPYSAFKACAYLYAVKGCKHPAGARLFINYCFEQECYKGYDANGRWSVLDNYDFKKTKMTAEEVNLTSPDFEGIYNFYPNVKAYWTYWRSLAN